jgi:tetratricopeptide (TPR) repeat protein
MLFILNTSEDEIEGTGMIRSILDIRSYGHPHNSNTFTFVAKLRRSATVLTSAAILPRHSNPFSVLAILLAVFLIGGCAGGPSAEAPAADPDLESSEDGLEMDTPGAVIFDATVAAQNSRFETAENMLTGLLEREPENIEALRLLARVYAADGKTSASSSTWGKVADLDPSDPDAAYEAGSALAGKEKWAEVRTKMISAETYGKADGRHYLLLGQAALELGYMGEAEKYLLKAGDAELAGTLLGKLYYKKGKTELAEAAFRKVLKKDSGNYIANLHLGYINYSRGRKEAALKYYRKAHRADPDDPLAILSMASLLEKLGNRTDAIKYYNRSLTLPTTPVSERRKVYISLVRLMLEGKMYSDLPPVASQGVGEFPDAGGIYFYWGEALRLQGNSEKAREMFKKAASDPAWEKHALERFHSIR